MNILYVTANRPFSVKIIDIKKSKNVEQLRYHKDVQPFRHIMQNIHIRKDKNSHNAIALKWAPEGKTKIGGPKTTWQRMVEKEREEGG